MLRKRPVPINPKAGQESVWDYPRPPRLEKTSKSIQVYFNGVCIIDTQSAYRVLETSHPPSYYLPPADIQMQYFQPAAGRSICEWKGQANYYSIVVGDKVAERVAWAYPRPTRDFAAIKDYVALYPAPMDKCVVDGEIVQPQPGEFYGGWITSDVVGPFKGIPGSWGW